MDAGDISELMIVFAVAVVPALGLTARFVLKPVVEALIRLKEGGITLAPAAARDPRLEAEVRALREEVADLRQVLGRIEEAESFHRALAAPPAEPAARD